MQKLTEQDLDLIKLAIKNQGGWFKSSYVYAIYSIEPSNIFVERENKEYVVNYFYNLIKDVSNFKKIKDFNTFKDLKLSFEQ